MLIAAWSGPRNLSTVMMYAFAGRDDCATRDEPFYAAYLHRTGHKHPMREEILASQPTDPAKVVESFADCPEKHVYLKLMAQHMIEGMPLDWAEGARHLHLIRHPARVIASFSARYELPSLDDIGFARQYELYQRFGGAILDSADIRRDPAGMLRSLCAALDIPFNDKMLTWPKGGHPSDGVWASHWYGAVHASTGFAEPEPPLPRIDTASQALCDEAMPYYESMSNQRLTAS